METAPRRSLAQALQTGEIPKEALAIINEGKPRPAKSRNETHAEVEDNKDLAVEASPASRGQVNLSVRLDQTLTDALLEVAFKRKLQRRKPFTQREIVAEALVQWLRKQGHTINY